MKTRCHRQPARSGFTDTLFVWLLFGLMALAACKAYPALEKAALEQQAQNRAAK